MNTIDKSTEDVDDAVFGRFAALEFPPRVEALISMLEQAHVDEAVRHTLSELFVAIQETYPLGHGCFANCLADSDPLQYYLTRIRPVLRSHLQQLREAEMNAIDNLADSLIATQ